MVTPRTLCHFVVQARALRVPELCDDHPPPSRLVTISLAEPRNPFVNTAILSLVRFAARLHEVRTGV